MPNPASAVNDPEPMRHAGRELLSLALIDSRNRSLSWLSAFDGADLQAVRSQFDAPQWIIGHAAWFQEYWVGRHVQRSRGGRADPAGPRLASIEPRADEAFDPARSTRAQRWAQAALPDSELRAYGAATLETTLELLERCDDSDDALHFFRLALGHEDADAETLACLAQAADLPAERGGASSPAHAGIWPARARRDALWLPAQRFWLGSAPGGFVPRNEQWAHEEAVPEFEIDAQPVQWAQYVEFIADGAYDDPRCWSTEGWAWAQATQRRAPRYVQQSTGAVLARRRGQVQRLAGAQAVMHVSWFEADAFCRWAGRRLPTELEWELAAMTAHARGFTWGDVVEWTAGRAAYWSPGEKPPAQARVARGASQMTVARCRHGKARRFMQPDCDNAFVGFRSCAP
jgi:gamma-glutamyl hercynylcysteine S-oxide synthase